MISLLRRIREYRLTVQFLEENLYELRGDCAYLVAESSTPNGFWRRKGYQLRLRIAVLRLTLDSRKGTGIALLDVASVVEEVSRPPRLLRAPGYQCLNIIKWVYSPKVVRQVFSPAIRDMQHEHIEALAKGQPYKAKWVLARGYWSIGKAVVAQVPVSLVKLVAQLWKAAN